MYYEKNGKEKVLNVTDWLRKTYGSEIKPEIQIVELHQSEEDVWVTVERKQATDFGTLVTCESSDIAVAVDIDDDKDDDDEEKVMLSFPPSTDIEINAKNLFTDKETLMNITTIFD